MVRVFVVCDRYAVCYALLRQRWKIKKRGEEQQGMDRAAGVDCPGLRKMRGPGGELMGSSGPGRNSLIRVVLRYLLILFCLFDWLCRWRLAIVKLPNKTVNTFLVW